MNELETLIHLLKDLPHAVVFVVAGYLFYKLVIVGSIYGLIRFAIVKIPEGIRHIRQARLEKAEEEAIVERAIKLNRQLDNMTICGCEDDLKRVLKRVASADGHNPRSFSSIYLHESDVAWLAAAVDEKIARDEKA